MQMTDAMRARLLAREEKRQPRLLSQPATAPQTQASGQGLTPGPSAALSCGYPVSGKVTLTLPLPPSANHYYRHVGPKVLISEDGRKYRALIGEILVERGTVALTGDLELTMDVYPPDRRRRDIDNLQKCLFDALKHGGLYGDDSQISKYTVERREICRGEGHVVVTVRERCGSR